MNPLFFSPFLWTLRTPGARLFQALLIAYCGAWIVLPQQAWAGCACSEVAVAPSTESNRLDVEPNYGSLVLDQEDVRLPGYSRIALTRKYDSLRKTFTMFGYGWDCSEVNYLNNRAGDIGVSIGGAEHTFKLSDNYANEDHSMQLSFTGENEAVVENRAHEKWYFSVTDRKCTKHVDPNGNATFYDTSMVNRFVGTSGGTNIYQTVFLLNSITYPDGRQMTFEYTSNLCTRAISPDGRTNDYSYTDGLLTGVSRDNGMALDYGYHTDSANGVTKGWLTSMAYANGAEVDIAYNGEYDTTNKLRVVEVTGPLGFDHSYSWIPVTDTNSCGCATTSILTDSLNRNTVFTYEQGGNVKRITNALNDVRTTVMVNGLRQSFTDYRGNATRYAHDSGNSSVLGKANVLAVTNTLGKVWSYGYNANNDRTAVISPLGQTNLFKYDAKGNLLAVTNALGQQAASFSYTTNGLLASITDARGNQTTLSRNTEGLVTNTVDALTNSWSREFDGSGNVISSADPLGGVVCIGYNSDRKPTVITNALGQVTRLAYDEMANLTNVTDALGNSVGFAYDQLQRTAKIRDALGNETKFSYDPESNLTVLSNALGHAYSYTFDAVNQTKTFVYPDASKETYLYDANGNMTGLTNRSGQVITAQYDAGNRLTTKTWEGTTNVVFSSGYDDADQLLTVVRTKSGVVESAITNTWDAANRITQQQQGLYAVGYGYDVAGNVTNVSYPSGANAAYSYDALNRISSIRDSTNATVLAAYEFDAAGRPTKRTLENGAETVYARDAAGRVTNMTLRLTATPANVLWSAAYGYDAVGNRAWVKDKDGRGDVYQYDATYQVTGVKYNVDDPTVGYASATNPSRTVTYTWDALGNRSSVVDNGSSTGYSVNNLNQYSSVGGTNLTYDTRGNLTGDGTWTFGYDHGNHLVSASKTGTTVSYAYDGMGRRISKTVNGTTTRYLYSGDDLIEERDGTGMVLAKYVYEAGVDRPVKVIKGANTYWFQQDALGNVVALVNASGQVAEKYTYDIFGAPTIKDGSGSTLSSSATAFLFTGREWDSETGLYHYRARACSPVLGRFLQPDPIDFDAGDSNLYRYCQNSPIYFVDPSGLDIVVNNSGGPLMASGNVGRGHGTGAAQAYGVVPSGATGGGLSNPLPAYATPGEAKNAVDPDFIGPHRQVGEIYDVDSYGRMTDCPGSDGMLPNRVRGDEIGPVTTVGKNSKGNLTQSRSGRLGAGWRYMWR